MFLKLFLSTLLLTGPEPAPAPPESGSDEAYFCAVEGMTLNYERRNEKSGVFWWRQTTHIDSAVRNGDGTIDIDFSTTVQPVEKSFPVDGPVKGKTVILPSGTIQIDLTSSLLSVARQLASGLHFKASGGISELGADLAPGDTLKDVHTALSWHAISYFVDITQRLVLRREQISVPAGTFDCIVIQEHKEERKPFKRHKNICLTWYAKGYGAIRRDSLKMDGSLEASEILVSFTL